MKQILFFILLMGVGLHSAEITEIDEYKVDLYYANGIMMVDDKNKAEQVWKTRVLLVPQLQLWNLYQNRRHKTNSL